MIRSIRFASLCFCLHLLFSAPPLWIVGSYGLWRVFRRAARSFAAAPMPSLSRSVLYVALLALPWVATWPTGEFTWRSARRR